MSIRIKRDSSGKPLPIKVTSSTIGLKVEVYPLTYGQSRSYDSFGKSLLDWTDEEKVRLISENVCSVDGEVLGDITVEDMVDELDAWTVIDLLQSVAVGSGMRRLFEDDESEESGNEEGVEES